ncbi:MAG: hypothetical protein AAGE52_20185 [Myxococcota bacterium]
MRRALFFAAAMVGIGCGSDATQIIVEVDADEEVRAAAGILRLQVVGRASETEPFDLAMPAFDDFIRVSSGDWPRRHVIAPQGGDAARLYVVTAEAISGDFRDLISQARRSSGFVSGETRVLRIFLSGADCRGVSCPTTPELTTCEQGLCLEVPTFPAELLPGEGGGGEADAGVDAAPDAFDGGDCEQDAPCDEELLPCEVGRIDCSSGEPICVSVGIRSATEVCRPAMGECDVAETCDGEAPTCPEDQFAEVGTVCADGFCNQGMCGACEPGATCDTENGCEIGRIECDEVGTPTCVGVGPLPVGTVCREPAGPCDEQEVCDGSSVACPTDLFSDDTRECRPSAGPCDSPEVCAGGPACPTDEFLTTSCRAAIGPCDEEEFCAGTGPECPDDAQKLAGSVCREGNGTCDPAEVCSGDDTKCPDDAFAAAGTPCGGTNACDGAGMCTDFACGSTCSTENACEVGVVVCMSGAEPRCVGMGPKPAGTECRAASADAECDVPEACDGNALACPEDAFREGGVCRAEAGVCDIAEECDGTGPNCPADRRAGTTTMCRPTNGVCDVPEFCNGGVDCPGDEVREAGYVCRDSEGPCDFDDVCNGSSRTCPNSPAVPDGNPCIGQPGVCVPGAECLDVVISEVAPGPNGFIELYNRSDDVSLDTCEITIQSGMFRFVPLDGEIPFRHFYLIGSPEDDADRELFAGLPSRDGSAQVNLICSDGRVDSLAWGAFGGGVAERPPVGGPGCGMAPMFMDSSFERKANAMSTVPSMLPGGSDSEEGNGHDTNKNCEDFITRPDAEPQNLSSEPEPP